MCNRIVINENNNTRGFLSVAFLLSAILFLCSGNTRAQLPVKDSLTTVKNKELKTADSASAVKPYEKIITGDAVTEKGMFTVHQVKSHYYFEIPDSLLNRDILLVTRMAKGPAVSMDAGMINGHEITSTVIRFIKGPGNKLFVEIVSRENEKFSADSSTNGLYRAVHNSNLPPLEVVFDIKAFSPTKAGSVIDVTDFLNGVNGTRLIYYLLGSGITLASNRCYIKNVRTYAANIEVRSIKTIIHGAGVAETHEVNNSFVLLPRDKMPSRLADERIGFFDFKYTDFDADPQSVSSYNRAHIVRWRLEPRPEDLEKYKHGELVEPVKPIVFYIDPATPKKWVPYLIQGVNDWKTVFEKAGFKNAIYALEAPDNDPNWSIEDAMHNAIVYVASDDKNAQGNTVVDPRTGEILESHIMWFHNVMALLHDWYQIQAGACDPRAGKVDFDDDLMGRLIRYVSSHEVGHALGLRHNFLASSTYSIDSLRNKQWAAIHGTTASIMDYARFNYVAQPEDSVTGEGLLPHIGPYDKWAIEWGYRCYPGLSPAQEQASLSRLVTERTEADPLLIFGGVSYHYLSSQDARSQAEDLSDNVLKAADLGIKNLKRIVPNLLSWNRRPGLGYNETLLPVYKSLLGQFNNYLMQATANIGSIEKTNKTCDEPGAVFKITSAARQRNALDFLKQQLFLETPRWLFCIGPENSLFPYLGATNEGVVQYLQKEVLQTMLSYRKFSNLMQAEAFDPVHAYTVQQLLNDMKRIIWGELNSLKPISQYRRNIQKLYAEQLVLLMHPRPSAGAFDLNLEGNIAAYSVNTDLHSLIVGHIHELLSEVKQALPACKDAMTRLHLQDIKERLTQALDPKLNPSDIFAQYMKGVTGITQSLDWFQQEQKDGCWK